MRLLRRAIHDPLLVNALSLATPFAAYLLGEAAHVSGVLAVAVAGLMIGHDTPRFTSGASRLQVSAVWRLADFLLQGFVFLLIGQQILPVVRGLQGVLVRHGRRGRGYQPWRGPGAAPAVAAADGGTAAGRAGDRRAELGRHPGRDQPGGDLHGAADHLGRAAVPWA